MPPALSEEEEEFDDYPQVEDQGSDDQSEGSEQLAPARVDNGPINDDDEEDEEAEDGDGDDIEGEFIVEKIVSHGIQDGKPIFKVKWEGYEDEADMTWEPEENLEAAPTVLQEYFQQIGGRHKLVDGISEKKAQANKRKRNRASAASAAELAPKKSRNRHPGDTTPPKEAEKFIPPSGSWESYIAEIDIVQNDDGKLVVYLTWKSGHKTRHDTSQVYKRCPQQMLQFYERHVKIVSGGNVNGDSHMENNTTS